MASYNVAEMVEKGWELVPGVSLPSGGGGHTPDPEPVKKPNPKPVEAPEVKVPAKSASRAIWREHAEGLGIDVSGMTRAQIQAAVADLTE